MSELEKLLREVKSCRLCEAHLPLGPRPVFQLSRNSRILLVGQAPGTKVHASGRPFTDPSGDRLRDWLGVTEAEFYDPELFALLPMGFCYPGRGKSGDLPPRKECAAAWRPKLLPHLAKVELTVLIGQYAIAYHLPDAQGTLTEIVRDWKSHWPTILPIPHPSPRNNLWLRKNPWFEQQVIPHLQERVSKLI